jgi:PAS domain S-box-containing protein
VLLDVTGRKKAEEALRASETRYRALFEAVDQGFCIIDVIFDGDVPVDYRFVEMNPAFEKHTGLENAEGRTARELLPNLEEHWFQVYGRVAQTGEPVRFVSGSGVMGRWFDVFAFRLDEPDARKVALLFKDISEQKRAESELAESRERLRAVLENSLDAAYRRDLRTDTYDYLSPIVAQVLGVEADSLRRMPIDAVLDHIHPDDRAGVARALEGGTRDRRGRVEYRFRGEDGRYRWVADHFTVQVADDGAPVFRTGIVRDVGDQKRAEVALRAAKEEAEQASQAKSQFLAVMSHELRTPLTGVIGFADLLQSDVLGPTTPKQQESLARIKASSWHLISIIDEILSLSRAEAGNEDVRRQDTDVALIVREIARIVEPDARARGLAVEYVDADQPATVPTDPGKVRQILINLVGNAAKYASDGAINVAVDRTDARTLRVHVRDTGPGIAEEDHERIFEPFTQLDSSHTRPGSGAGLGLAICRRLARMLGGDVSLDSAPGEGSTFTLHLPRGEPADGG